MIDSSELNKITHRYILELEKLEQTDYIKGQLSVLKIIVDMDNIREVISFYGDNLLKIEKIVYEGSSDNLMMRGYLMGMYKVLEFMRGAKNG